MPNNLITVRLSASDRAKLEKRAEENGTTISAVARDCIAHSLRHGDLERAIVVKVQAEARLLCDDFLNHYYEAQANTAKAFSAELARVANATTQAIAPKPVDQSAEVIRQIEERARLEGRPLSTAEATHIQRLRRASEPTNHPPQEKRYD